ncbi:TatD family hydrolase [Marinomonas pollencensis]|uniref:TatD DNase family protein n=1 Tax=Marinomonas pollencensis TaxID=491954 RepID=A0A3E0DPL8_9GAMM|nr:TatD family hydrolase [Marinomonas pollencensis]REG84809.1 TatD DNase family protein [Marinomonas pollencensis]
MYNDSHCHLDFSVFDSSRDALMSACQQAGVEGFLVPSTTRSSWQRVTRLAVAYPQWRVAYGLHPYFLGEAKSDDIEHLAECCETNDALAIGEIGLDCWPGAMALDKQQFFFSRQLIIARDLKLPIIVHARKSYDLVIKAVRDTGFIYGGIVHAFNGSLVQANRLQELGFILGIGGTITYPRAKKAHRVLAELEDTAFVLETDSPDMPVCGFQGEVNTPLSIPRIAQSVARIRNSSVADIARQTNNNLLSTFPKWYKDTL